MSEEKEDGATGKFVSKTWIDGTPSEDIPTHPYRILIEPRSRRQGGKLFHIHINGVENELEQKQAVALAKRILKYAGEKE